LDISAQMGNMCHKSIHHRWVLALLDIYEQEWPELDYSISVHSMSSSMFLLVSYLGRMQGFEVMWTDLAALRYNLQFCKDSKDKSAISWPILGRSKGHNRQRMYYMIPIAGTINSGIGFLKWTQQVMCQLAIKVHRDGWALQ